MFNQTNLAFGLTFALAQGGAEGGGEGKVEEGEGRRNGAIFCVMAASCLLARAVVRVHIEHDDDQ